MPRLYQRSQSSSASAGRRTRRRLPPPARLRELFQVGLDASWEVDIFGGTRRNIEAAGADLKAAVEDRRDVLITLVGDVGNNYLNLRGFQQQLAIVRHNLEAQKHTADITRRRFEAGTVSALDVANAKAQVATTEAQVPVLESSVRAAIYSLGVLLGREPAALEKDLIREGPIPATPPEVPVGLPSDLLRRRPDIRRAEAQLHAATARIGVATADLFPKFSLTGSFGFSSNDLTKLGNLASSKFWSFGPSGHLADLRRGQHLLEHQGPGCLNGASPAHLSKGGAHRPERRGDRPGGLRQGTTTPPDPGRSGGPKPPGRGPVQKAIPGRQDGFLECPDGAAQPLYLRRCPGAKHRHGGHQPDRPVQGPGRRLGEDAGANLDQTPG